MPRSLPERRLQVANAVVQSLIWFVFGMDNHEKLGHADRVTTPDLHAAGSRELIPEKLAEALIAY